ncbi:MAG: chromosome segregation protein SMC [Clostridia bacterium]|nr:chromosome segregation protein SMC [Clostridia bacterium]
MYLKELDLQGFKSFPDKVKLEFNKGITAVVGPNGSGKSNISDAVRWVLGEQRPKSLRGGKMEDVIFAGTANRRPVGFAEVSMVVDNSDRKMPVDYSEIKITRRVYRSGESGYMINGTECRLKDIYELFMDTGIGRDGYSIVGQGKIDEILSNKSEDRRQLFEEAAGIVKYKNRKTEAETKLEKEQQNLVRITDIISEIESKIEPLEKQAQKAKKYLELYGEMKEADIRLFRINGERLEKETANTAELIKNAAENMEESEKTLEKLKAEEAEIRNAAEELSAQMEELNREAARLAGEIERNGGICRLTEEQIKNLEASSERLEREKTANAEKIAADRAETEALRETLEKAEKNIADMRASLKEKEEALNAMLEKQSEHEKKVEGYKAEMIEKIKQTADIKSSAERTEAMLEQFSARKKQLAEEKGSIERRLKDKRIQAKSAELRAEQSADTADEIKRSIERLENKKAGIEKVISVIDDGLSQKRRQLTEKESRLRVLSAMEREHEGYYKSVKAVLRLKDNGNLDFKGVRGAVAQLFKTDEKYEIAVETALGGSAQSIVVDSENDAKTAVAYLKENKLGRATFLPIATVRGKTLGDEKERLLKEKGVIAAACDLVRYDKEYKGIAESLLGRILVIDNMDNAIAFARKYKQSYRLVTVDGESFMPGGAITGGSIGKKDGGVFGRKREMEALKADTEGLRAACEGLESEKEKNRLKADGIDEEAKSLEDEAKEADIKRITAVNEAERIKTETAELEEQLRLALIEERQLEEQKLSAESEREKAKEELKTVENDIVELQYKLNSGRESSESGRSGRETAAEEITALKIEISSAGERKQAQADNLRRLEDEISALEAEKASLDKQIEENVAETEEKKKLAEAAEESTKRSISKKEDCERRLSEVSEGRKHENDRLTESQEKTDACRETILKYKNELVRLEAKNERLEDEKKRLSDDMWENYEITYPEALKIELDGESPSDIKRRAGELKAEIKALGSVNVNAVDEYKETKERYEFLSGQKNDIMDAEEKLKKIIADLSELMEKQFREKLEVISENFNEVFREMFGGGRAYLKLSDEDDVLGSGIDIIAQPPGKNLQNMMLLSGGERALTAIAILFSILKMKPSPFCILDEIEAALDDANVHRYGDYLRRFSGDTQFIVITHRKGTMESADVLYGVTMQEQGVSKIVSVKFDEAEGR